MRRYDAAPLSKVERTPQGGLRVEGILTKTGVFQYRQPDGSVRKEYRPADEVFKEDTLSTFKGAPITVGHPGIVTPDNWQEHSVGHVSDNVRRSDTSSCEYVYATLNIQRADAIKKIESGELKELSCGYDVDLDETPGEVNGERYDAVQRNIRGNHVAMGPSGWGRAGKDVAMRLDSKGDESFSYTENNMADKDSPKPDKIEVQNADVNIRVDGQKEIDRLSAENAMLKAKVADLNKKLSDTSRLDSLVDERVSLVETAKKYLKDFDAKGKTSRQIKAAVVLARNPSMKLDSVSDDFVEAAYQMALSLESSAPVHDSLGQVRADAVRAVTQEDPISAAYKRNLEANLNAWKQPLSTVTQVN